MLKKIVVYGLSICGIFAIFTIGLLSNRQQVVQAPVVSKFQGTPAAIVSVGSHEVIGVKSTTLLEPVNQITEKSSAENLTDGFNPAVSRSVAVRITQLYKELKKNGSIINDIVSSQKPLIPNIYHFVRFNQSFLKFYEMLAIKSVLDVAHADFVYIHCNQQPQGRYWDKISSEKRIKIIHREPPKSAFGKTFGWIQHASDLARIQVLREYGGIYLDNDCLIINDQLEALRRHKCVVAKSSEERHLGNMILMGTKDCVFLQLYEELYKLDYRSDLWYYNGGELPQYALLDHFPGIAYFTDEGIQQGITWWLWKIDVPLINFQKRYRIIHLFYGHKGYMYNDTIEYDEENIKKHPNSFSRIARWLMYNHEDIYS